MADKDISELKTQEVAPGNIGAINPQTNTPNGMGDIKPGQPLEKQNESNSLFLILLVASAAYLIYKGK